MLSTLFTSGARNISNSTASINYEGETLRRSPDPEASGVIAASEISEIGSGMARENVKLKERRRRKPVKEEIVMERHASIGDGACVEMASGEKVILEGVLLEKEGQDHGVACGTGVIEKRKRMVIRRIGSKYSGGDGGGEEEDGESQYPSHYVRLGRGHRRSERGEDSGEVKMEEILWSYFLFKLTFIICVLEL